MALLYEESAFPEEAGDGRTSMTLLRQIRLWMKMKEPGEQYHDEQDDAIIEELFDLSPEVVVPSDEDELPRLPEEN
ncbi:hypothetical protein ABH15_04020 [Methanoculleus taiwanensis]|uniref:Uncharacterized protein n=1 Tax=Methanoculleus taiwanensis TaxID=1550565 RepID=A0A498H4A3_9EURY|nr:hypothetical protein [Methanoculleus taiwanensis]RXE57277.1 hypothetical protein ABH15_04020 [Methanoculleus taiwanensis]